MTIKDCIDIVDNQKPNGYSILEKVMWLSFLDGIIIDEVLKTHEGYDGRYDNFEGYTEDKLSVPLIVPSPYDRLYTAYLKMKIDAENGETARYNNSAALYNTYLSEYKRHYHKTHMPLDVTERKKPMGHGNSSLSVSEAMYENLVRDLTHNLTEFFSSSVSHDKLYDVVKEFIQNNLELFKEKKKASPSKTTTIYLPTSKWVKDGNNRYSQVVSISGITEYSKVDLQPTAEQLLVFYEKDLAFVAENEDGVVTVYCIGQKPQSDYTIQTTITEVEIDG